MRKIISLFQRDYEGTRLVFDAVVPGAEWVLAGEGVATRKWDGTCCMVQGGKLYKRYDAKKGKEPPAGFIPAQEPDENTGHWPGWLPVGDGPEDKWFRAGYNSATMDGTLPGALADWTYELVGPRINGGNEGLDFHTLIAHGKQPVEGAPRDFASIRTYLERTPIEGIVWWRDPSDPDCEKVKIKAKDFGLKRTAP